MNFAPFAILFSLASTLNFSLERLTSHSKCCAISVFFFIQHFFPCIFSRDPSFILILISFADVEYKVHINHSKDCTTCVFCLIHLLPCVSFSDSCLILFLISFVCYGISRCKYHTSDFLIKILNAQKQIEDTLLN